MQLRKRKNDVSQILSEYDTSFLDYLTSSDEELDARLHNYNCTEGCSMCKRRYRLLLRDFKRGGVPHPPCFVEVICEAHCKVRWDKPLDNGEPVTGYTIKFWKNCSLDAVREIQHNDVKTRHVRLTDMDTEGTYSLNICATNKLGDGVWSPPIEFSFDPKRNETERDSNGNGNKEGVCVFRHNKPYYCILCPKSFKHLEAFRRHRRRTTRRCRMCSTILQNSCEFNAHKLTHKWTRKVTWTQCKLCKKKVGAGYISMHTKRCGKPRKGTKKKCPHCPKVLSPSGLYMHIKKEHVKEYPYECAFCSKKFVAKFPYNLHVGVHTGVKPYQCKYCEKRFLAPSGLTVHLKIHTGVKDVACKVCEKLFTTHVQRDTHFQAKHNPALICAVCGRRLTSRISARNHLKMHLNYLPHECETCHMSFESKNALIQHVRVHTKICPFRCDVCKNYLASKELLVRHVQKHMRYH